jgi:hypothetical protein
MEWNNAASLSAAHRTGKGPPRETASAAEIRKRRGTSDVKAGFRKGEHMVVEGGGWRRGEILARFVA